MLRILVFQAVVAAVLVVFYAAALHKLAEAETLLLR
jgi:hypothetical protein